MIEQTYRTTKELVIDGQVIPEQTVVATVELDPRIPLHRVVAGVSNGSVTMSATDPAPQSDDEADG